MLFFFGRKIIIIIIIHTFANHQALTSIVIFFVKHIVMFRPSALVIVLLKMKKGKLDLYEMTFTDKISRYIAAKIYSRKIIEKIFIIKEEK